MISFKLAMQNEKIAIIALVVIIVGALSAYLIATNDGDIFENLFGEKQQEGSIAIGDCIDVNYIGKYASNGTVFDSSYSDVENKSGGTPLKVFVSLNKSDSPPAEYQGYSSGIIEGLMEGLIDSGLKEGEHSTIGPIPPEKAYGANKLKIGDVFNTSSFALNTLNPSLSLNQTLQVTNLTSDYISLKWINVENFGKFTMPQIVLNDLESGNQTDMIILPPPYFIWENSTEIINIYDESIVVKTTPTKSEKLSENFEIIQYGFGSSDVMFIFPDATEATWSDASITFTSSPDIGNIYYYNYSYYGQEMKMNYTVEAIDNDTINISILSPGSNEAQYQEVNRTIEFDRTFSLPRTYKNIPSMYQAALFGPDLEREGYEIHELAGESLIFEVTIEKIYKTSQEES
ncbi:MAG: FKBP-type peptidyl-prolyl cis-trans isomerase [Candidatus Thermoplasmatota archaeon]|nr:FKBP-type peptidyl-prolyl cis-trans isomerase [Candidatus Thermoplasmatota archaeon]